MSSLPDRMEGPRRKPPSERYRIEIGKIIDWFMLLIVICVVLDFVATGKIGSLIVALWFGRSLGLDWGKP